MSAAAPQVLRRARRLLPLGLAVAAMLPPADGCWEASPLSRLRLARGRARQGVLGLRLDSALAGHLNEFGLDALRACAVRWGPAAGGGAIAWSVWPHAPWYWTMRAEAGLGLLLDPVREALWLYWREPGHAGAN